MTLIFTFGDGQRHAGKFVRISGETREECRIQMFEQFGDQWAFCYTEEEWKRWEQTRPFWCPIETELGIDG